MALKHSTQCSKSYFGFGIESAELQRWERSVEDERKFHDKLSFRKRFKMRKSSLGRRSSVMSSIGRPSCAEKNVSRLCENKKSLIPKPCSGVKGARSSSAERDSSISTLRKDPPSTLQRSKSYLSIDVHRTSTPCFTPQQTIPNTFSRLRLSEGGNRSSSVGGAKSAKKDSRPVAEKSFQSASQMKIQQFFMTRAPELLDKGSIKPMTTSMFVDLVNFLLAKFDHNIVVNKTNPIEGVLQICKVLNYRGKAEKSWIRTVNTPHSWPHVVSFLVWLVELYEVSDALQIYEAMYPENIEDEADVNDINFKVIVPHLLSGYNLFQKNQDDSEEMGQFLMKHKIASNVDERDIERLQEEYAQLQSELNHSKDAAEEEELTERKAILETLKRDITNTREYNYSTEQYVTKMDEKHKAKVATFQDYESRIQTLNEEKTKLHELVSQQEMSQDQKKEIETNLALLQREIQQLDETINEYKTEIYKEDLKLVSVKSAFNKLVQAYNKEIIVNLAVMPELKAAEIEDTTKLLGDSPESEKPFQHLDDRLSALKMQLKTQRQEIETEIEKTKLLLQKKEDDHAREQEELENLEKECCKLENEVTVLRKSLLNDKEQLKKSLAKIQKDAEREREKMESIVGNDEELNSLREKKEKLQKQYNEYVEGTNATLLREQQVITDMEAKFEDVTKQKMAKRQKMIDEIVNRKPAKPSILSRGRENDETFETFSLSSLAHVTPAS